MFRLALDAARLRLSDDLEQRRADHDKEEEGQHDRSHSKLLLLLRGCEICHTGLPSAMHVRNKYSSREILI